MHYDKETVEKAWIQGVGSRVITPLDLRDEQIDLDDVTHSLGHLCRYTGRTRRFYSVAEHSVIVFEAAKALGFNRGARRWALAHDFGEAYLSDVSNPLKRTEVFELYRALEASIDVRIRERFGIAVTPEEIAAVRVLDVEACNVERADLLDREPQPWNMPVAPREFTKALDEAYRTFSSQRARYDLTFGQTLREYALEVLGE
jgi:uncharacterized protein